MPAAPKPLVVVTRKLPDAVETRMMELFRTELNDSDRQMERAGLVEAMGRADVLVPTVTDRIDAACLEAAGPQLRLLASFGAGVDHIDLAAARERGVMVTNTPGVLTGDTADMTMALILSVSRRLAEGERLVRTGGWRGLGADGAARPPDLPASGSALSAWAGSGRRWRGGRAASASRSTTTTAGARTPTSRRSWRRPTGRASTRCWRAWTSCRSTARARRPPTTCCRAAGWR